MLPETSATNMNLEPLLDRTTVKVGSKLISPFIGWLLYYFNYYLQLKLYYKSKLFIFIMYTDRQKNLDEM